MVGVSTVNVLARVSGLHTLDKLLLFRTQSIFDQMKNSMKLFTRKSDDQFDVAIVVDVYHKGKENKLHLFQREANVADVVVPQTLHI